ncbi:penicillin-binding protein activator LpoB [Flavobacterium rakeshii]|uniref:Penicillin-binding protein activator LpoB n=1 Tax=Flavobacterium rakeshii TaxID=1038845 RepID=A0A6N8HBV3_9FLAO|nr:penicillin-binding protein activator LpoB [Flavobacterium rakeshii]MEE1898477.1 penicillin-binding protein activator LpoB [Flavobacterium rakeshii]MUV03035.1 penicillin-binding protein activator LpoB [Flavobacterium rakeshii]
MKTSYKFILAFVLGLALTSCASKVQRMSEDSVTDLSGRWNETDSRLTAEEITAELMSHSWYSTYAAENGGKKPVIIVGMITNKSHEHIATETFSKDIEKEIINSGRMKLVQGGPMREEIRAERADQQNYSSQSTMKKFGLENGADFMLQGTINSIVDQKSKDKTVYYQVDLELTNIQTNDKVWIGDKKIKKYIGKKNM